MPTDTAFADPEMGEPFLLTPGPLTTAAEVKHAMLRDWGSWDGDFRAMTARLRAGILALLGPGAEGFDCVPMQGSGSYLVEAMIGSFVPPAGAARPGKVLVLANGAYGLRAAETCRKSPEGAWGGGRGAWGVGRGVPPLTGCYWRVVGC